MKTDCSMRSMRSTGVSIGPDSDCTIGITGITTLGGKDVMINREIIGAVVEQDYHQGGCSLRRKQQ